MGTLWGTWGLSCVLNLGALFKPSQRGGGMRVAGQHAPPKSSQLRDTQGEGHSGGTRHTLAWHPGGGAGLPPEPCISGLPHPHQATLGTWVCGEKIPEAAHSFGVMGNMASSTDTSLLAPTCTPHGLPPNTGSGNANSPPSLPFPLPCDCRVFLFPEVM